MCHGKVQNKWVSIYIGFTVLLILEGKDILRLNLFGPLFFFHSSIVKNSCIQDLLKPSASEPPTFFSSDRRDLMDLYFVNPGVY